MVTGGLMAAPVFDGKGKFPINRCHQRVVTLGLKKVPFTVLDQFPIKVSPVSGDTKKILPLKILGSKEFPINRCHQPVVTLTHQMPSSKASSLVSNQLMSPTSGDWSLGQSLNALPKSAGFQSIGVTNEW